jgi:hypothetical protein
MNRKEFQARLELTQLFGDWAATQPGYKPLVTRADVDEVMKKLRKWKPFKQEMPTELPPITKAEQAEMQQAAKILDRHTKTPATRPATRKTTKLSGPH